MAGEEDAFEHEEPDPRCDYDTCEREEAEEDERWRGNEDFDAKFENLDGFVEISSIVIDAPGPENGEA